MNMRLVEPLRELVQGRGGRARPRARSAVACESDGLLCGAFEPLSHDGFDAYSCPIADSLSVQQTRTDASHIRPFPLGKHLLCVLLGHAHRADVRDGTVADAGDAELGQSVILTAHRP